MSRNKTYTILTFGCQMNEHDSEVISGMFQMRGYVELPETERDRTDIMIINTCSIRENADKRFFGTVGQLKKIKIANPELVVCVCGCMMQQEHITEKLRRSYPWVDVIFGTHNIHEFPDMLEELFENRKREAAGCGLGADRRRFDVERPALQKGQIRSSKSTRVERIYPDRESIVEGLPAKRLFHHKSFVNIMYGCNNFCTYCIVPYTRGREKSRRPEDIIREVKELVADGVKEITLLGQNVNSYKGVSGGTAHDQQVSRQGVDRSGVIQEAEACSCRGAADGSNVTVAAVGSSSVAGDAWDFADLIYALNDIEGLERIRFMTSHPKDLSDKLIDAFARCDKLCKYIHLPVQSGSSSVLARMNRKYDRARYLQLVRKLREAVPGIAISTDIIVGFPGETEEEFCDTLSLAEEVGYDSAFTFLYSPRRGTPAAGYDDQIPEDVKHQRFNRLVEVINTSSKTRNAAYVGRTEYVLVDGPDKKSGGNQASSANSAAGNWIVNSKAGSDGAGLKTGNEGDCFNGVGETLRLNGRTDSFKLVDFAGDRSLIGKIVKVEITGSNTFSLTGRLVP